MKKILTYCLLSFSIFSNAQDFTWVRGSSTSGPIGNYGTMGTPNSTNDPGGRHGCAKWTDAAGNLWVFGGEGYSNTTTMCWLSDLWKYDITTNQWTWMRGSSGPNAIGVYGTLGVASSTAEPGAREFSASWTDASGNLWMFGGDGFGNNATFGRLGDLWKYTIATNQWTWMHGFTTVAQNGVYGTQGVASASNFPGCRYGAGSWTDNSGNFWMFGGRGLGAVGVQGYVSDLWKFTPSTNQWTWMNGPTTTAQYGNYGTLGTAASTNKPGGRYFPACWIDASNNLYMLGGLGFAATQVNYMDDFWKYDPSTNNWTWINGSSGVDASGVYGTLGTPSSSVNPGARMTAASWHDASGNFWLFGGHGWSASSSAGHGELNDLFKYNPTTNQWTWMKGANSLDQNGTYGAMGIAASTNMPGAREYNNWWSDPINHRFWLFGGEGYGISNTSGDHLNDLWMYQYPCSPDSIVVSPGTALCSGAVPTFTAVKGGTAINWYLTASSTASIANGSTLSVGALTTAATQTVYSYFAQAKNCTVTPRASITITINPLPTLTITTSPANLCSGNTATVSGSGASTYTWTGFTSNVSPSQTLAVTTQTSLTLMGTTVNGCTNTAVIQIPVNPSPTLSVAATPATLCAGKSSTFSASGATTYTWTGLSTTNTSSSQIVTATTHTYYLVTGAGSNGCTDTAQVELTVHALPVLSIAASQKTICIHHSATFTVSGASSYTWDAANMSHTITVTPTVTTSYTVTGIDANGCVNTATISEKVDMCTGIANNQMSSVYINVFPNPSKGSFSVKTDAAFTEANFVIINSLGQKVVEQKISSVETLIKSGLAAGIYYYELRTEGNKSAKGKLIIE